jgi:hypothetical protein
MKRQAKRKQAVQHAQSENIGRGPTPTWREDLEARTAFACRTVAQAITFAVIAKAKARRAP